MINLAVINIRKISKIICIIIICIILFFIFVNILKNIKFNEDGLVNTFFKSSFENTIIVAKYYNLKEQDRESGFKKILISELAVLSDEEIMENENQEEIIEFENTLAGENNIKEIIPNGIVIEPEPDDSMNLSSNDSVKTKVIEKNNKKDTYTDVYKSVKIKNESKYKLTEEMVKPNYNLNNKKDIIIYHTHTCESYTPDETGNYQASGNFRTTDLNYNVTRVGKELKDNLIKLNFNAIQNTTYHDYPAYTGSYSRALNTINNIVSTNSNAEFIIDLHRDALGSNSSYAPCVQINDEIAAQLMFVIGTDGGGLEHNNWLNNFKLAIKIQEKANELYPGLFKPIILRNSRYNQHVKNGACIIEVGATGNTITQCKASMKYLAEIIKNSL